jgi:hypothetical protein
MAQNSNQVQWDSKPDTSGLSTSQSGVQWDSTPDVSGLNSNATYHSNPAYANYAAPTSPSRYSSKSPQAQAQSDLVNPGKDKPIPKPIQYAMEAAPFLEVGSAAIAARSLEPLIPAARAVLGSYAGGQVGRGAGYMVGHPDAGEVIGSLVGGIAGGNSGPYNVKLPTARSIPAVIAPPPEVMPPVQRGVSPVSSAPYELTPPSSAGEPAVQNRFNFPKDVAPRPVQTIPQVRMPQGPSVSDSLLLQPEAPSTPNTAMRSPMSNLNDLIDQQLGVQKLQPNVPLREQINPSTSVEVPIHRNPMEAANGKAIFDAAKGNPETLQAIHKLTRVDLRQALLASGEDMDQITVSDSKYAGKGSISREMAFNRLLGKGYNPEQIIKLAKGTK